MTSTGDKSTSRERKTELTLREASEALTLGETRKIEQHFGGGFGASPEQGGLRSTDTVAGLIWALERRRDLAEGATKLTEWADLDGWTLREVNAYFADEPLEADDDAPETLEGKGA